MQPYSLYRRGKIFYARFKLPAGGWSTAVSTREKNKSAAIRWCVEYLKKNPIIPIGCATLCEFSTDFFDWNGEWANDKKIRGLRLGRRHCRERTDLLKNHLIPALGNVKLSSIDRNTIKQFRNELHGRGYSGGTINKILSTLKTILDSAEEKNLISAVPKIDRASERSTKKGILTIDEAKKLFSVDWTDQRGYVANLVAATTGMRMGEIRALQVTDVNLIDGYIHVHRSYDFRFQELNETTKTGRKSYIFIPARTKCELKKLIEANPYGPESFIFYSTIKPNVPAVREILTNPLYVALCEIGITEEERKQRNITFHSWRYWLNSLLINANIPMPKIQNIIRHQTAQMTDHYFILDEMRDVIDLQNSIFGD